MTVRQIPIALVGFGNASRRLAELLVERKADIEQKYQAEFICRAIATAQHGYVIAQDQIDLRDALKLVRRGEPLSNLKGINSAQDSFEVIKTSSTEIVVETTPLSVTDGEPARSHIELALDCGKHVVTANKGPLAFAARELRERAISCNRIIRYESTVMDGTPIFNLINRTLPLVEVKAMRGIINSTTNYILTAMESGRSFESALGEAQAVGIAEADPSLDIEGWDAAVKATVLANTIMNGNLKPDQVNRTGIRALDSTEVVSARNQGNKIRLITRVERYNEEVIAKVSPEVVYPGDILFSIDEYSNALIIETDLMGTIAIVEQSPNNTQTAYGLLSDLISIAVGNS